MEVIIGDFREFAVIDQKCAVGVHECNRLGENN